MRRGGLLLATALLGSGCAIIAGIEDHTLSTTSTTSDSSTSGATGGAGGAITGTGGSVPNDCPPPDLGPTTCAPGLADCDGDGTCDVTLATDGAHCGACQHDCLGGACQAGVCQKVAITPAFSPSEAFGPMAVHQGRVYYAAGPHEANIIYSVPVGGGAAPDVVSADPVGEVYHLAVYSDTQTGFLFASAHDNGAWVIHGMLADGGTPNDTADLLSFSTGMAVDAAGVIYVAEQNHILRIDTQTTPIAISDYPIRGLAIDGQYAYWSTYPDAGSGVGSIYRTTLTGQGLMGLATGLGRPGEIALDEGSVYWTDAELGTITRTPKGGGDVETIISGQISPRYITVAGDDIYWSATGGVYRARLCALADKPVRLTPDAAGALLSDGKHLLATDTVTHEVLRFAR